MFYEKPFLKFERILETYLATAPRGFNSFRMAMPVWMKDKLFQKNMLSSRPDQSGGGSSIRDRFCRGTSLSDQAKPIQKGYIFASRAPAYDVCYSPFFQLRPGTPAGNLTYVHPVTIDQFRYVGPCHVALWPVSIFANRKEGCPFIQGE